MPMIVEVDQENAGEAMSTQEGHVHHPLQWGHLKNLKGLPS